MDKLFVCPRCRTQNFIGKERFAVLDKSPLHCWRCESEISREQILEMNGEDAQIETEAGKGIKDEKITVLVTVGTKEEAVKIAQALLEDRLIACANIIPGIRSLYRWKGKVCDDQEVLMLLKTVRAHFSKLKDRVLELHSYDVPEVIGLPIIEGSEAYLHWVEDETRH